MYKIINEYNSLVTDYPSNVLYNLLKEGLGTVVERTSLSRKLTIDGMTKAYPVYIQQSRTLPFSNLR